MTDRKYLKVVKVNLSWIKKGSRELTTSDGKKEFTRLCIVSVCLAANFISTQIQNYGQDCSFAAQSRIILSHYKHVTFNLNVARQSVCLVFEILTVNNYDSLFNCSSVGRASDLIMFPTYSYSV